VSTPEQSPDELVRAGRAALSRGAWAEARRCFLEALRGEETPEALEGLGTASWGLSDTEATFDARLRAYSLYHRLGDMRGAARLAARMAIDHFYFRGEYAVAGGWIRRARHLLDGFEPGPELGWVAVAESQIVAWAESDAAAVRRLSAQAAALGKSFGDTDLELLGLAFEGMALVYMGMIGEGMRRLDEATVAAAAGEMHDIDAACTACCCLVFACEAARDLERAAQWIERLRERATRWSHPTLFYFCRTHYAGLLIWQGAWQEAEAELSTAITELAATQPALAAEALLRLAGLRSMQGRLEDAAALVERASAPPFRALAGHFILLAQAGLAFSQGDVETTVDLAERFLRVVPKGGEIGRVGGLELLFHALVMRGDYARAQDVLAGLQAAAGLVGTGPMQASVRFAEGTMAMVEASFETAKLCFEDAIDLLTQSGAPFETAQARLGLAQSLLALGRGQSAVQQAREALKSLQQLGAQPMAAFAQG
jgi:tetratricopeptide (TPR) repeat protein